MELVNKNKGVVYPPMGRSMGVVCPKIINCRTYKKPNHRKGTSMKRNNNTEYIMQQIIAKLNNETKNNNVEAETMTNENNKNMDNTGALDVMSFDNLAELIPEDERAVSEINLAAENKIVVVNSIEPIADLALQIPETERAEAEESLIDLTDATEYGVFTPVLGMKGFITDTGHRLYAKICKEPTGLVIRYRQQYSDGRYSDEMTINQSTLALASSYNFMSNKISVTKLRNVVETFLVEASLDYYGKILCPSEGLDIIAVLKMLIDKYQELPTEENMLSILEQPEKLYKRIIRVIKDRRLDIMDEHESYYTLNKDQINILAEELNTKKNQLLKKLREYRFLYITDSSEGYQTNVRFKPYGEFLPKSHTEWCYCVLKLDYLAKKIKQRAKQ